MGHDTEKCCLCFKIGEYYRMIESCRGQTLTRFTWVGSQTNRVICISVGERRVREIVLMKKDRTVGELALRRRGRMLFFAWKLTVGV